MMDVLPRLVTMTFSDDSTYAARLRHVFGAWDPTLLVVPRATIDRSRRLVSLAEEGRVLPASVTPAELTRAKQIVADAVHPVTGDVLPNFCRKSSAIPVNSLIAAAMISTSSVSGTAGLHIYYQAYQSAVRYANHADERHPLQSRRLWLGWGLATGSAVMIGVGVAHALRDAPRRLRPLRMVVPHLAVACAGGIGIFMHNEGDARDGVELVDGEGEVRGVSVEAGRASLGAALALHAVTLPACQLLLPPLFMRYAAGPWLAQLPGMQRLSFAFPLALGTTFVCVAGVAPLATACFPRRLAFSPDMLEPELASALARPVQPQASGSDAPQPAERLYYYTAKALY